MDRPGWDEYFMRLAALAASRSTCPRRQVGAVLVLDQRVIATGYNGSLRGQPHCAEVGCLMVDGHCKRTVHAELNALLQCALHGASSRGAVLFTTSSPCLDCANALVQAGVGRVVYRDAYADHHSLRVLGDAGVALRQMDAPEPVADGVGGQGGTEGAGAPHAGPSAERRPDVLEGGARPRAVGAASPRWQEAAFIAGSAEVDGDVELGAGVGIWYGAVLRGDIAPIRVGPRSNVQDGCILHTDADRPCLVGSGVTVGHGAVLHGCVVEDDALIGMRATVLSGAVIGRGAIVGAGALVTEGQAVPPGMLVVGVPARVVRPVRPEERERAASGVRHYVELADLHRRSGHGTGAGDAT